MTTLIPDATTPNSYANYPRRGLDICFTVAHATCLVMRVGRANAERQSRTILAVEAYLRKQSQHRVAKRLLQPLAVDKQPYVRP